VEGAIQISWQIILILIYSVANLSLSLSYGWSHPQSPLPAQSAYLTSRLFDYRITAEERARNEFIKLRIGHVVALDRTERVDFAAARVGDIVWRIGEDQICELPAAHQPLNVIE